MSARSTVYRRWATAAVLSLAIGALFLPASASAGGGLKPSQAPLIAVGQHYFGNTAHSPNAGVAPVDLWRLPPLLTGDAVTIGWNSNSNYEPIQLCLAHDIDDYDWAERSNWCNGSRGYEVASNGSARSVLEVKSATSAAFLEFWGDECEDCNEPYDFVVESIQHTIGVGLKPVFHIRSTATLTATATLSNDAAVPDGLKFFLKASAFGQALARYEGISSGGSISFPVRLPPQAQGQHVTFTVVRPADPQYLAAKSATLRVKVSRPTTPPHHHHRHRHHRHRH
jgi:hypothetical protein